jgi:hypothetical protein
MVFGLLLLVSLYDSLLVAPCAGEPPFEEEAQLQRRCSRTCETPGCPDVCSELTRRWPRQAATQRQQSAAAVFLIWYRDGVIDLRRVRASR